jgi:acetyl esterase/lipase
MRVSCRSISSLWATPREVQKLSYRLSATSLTKCTGGVAVLSSIELLRLKLPQPAGSVLISPWLDMSLRLHQQGGNAAVESDYLYHGNESIPMLTAMFVGDRSGTDPDVNPFYRNPEEIEKICSC